MDVQLTHPISFGILVFWFFTTVFFTAHRNAACKNCVQIQTPKHKLLLLLLLLPMHSIHESASMLLTAGLHQPTQHYRLNNVLPNREPVNLKGNAVLGHWKVMR